MTQVFFLRRQELPPDFDRVLAKAKTYESPSPIGSRSAIAAYIALQLVWIRSCPEQASTCWQSSILASGAIVHCDENPLSLTTPGGAPQNVEPGRLYFVVGCAVYAARLWPLIRTSGGILVPDTTLPWQWITVVEHHSKWWRTPWTPAIVTEDAGQFGFIGFRLTGDCAPALPFALARGDLLGWLEARFRALYASSWEDLSQFGDPFHFIASLYDAYYFWHSP